MREPDWPNSGQIGALRTNVDVGSGGAGAESLASCDMGSAVSPFVMGAVASGLASRALPQ